MRETLTIWQEMVSPHIFPLAGALAPYFASVRLVTFGDLNANRRAIGWQDAQLPGVEQVHLDGNRRYGHVLSDRLGKDDIHFLPGIKPMRWLWSAQYGVFRSKARIILASEAPWPQSGLLKQSMLETRDALLAKVWNRRAEMLFATGDGAEVYYRARGFRQVRSFGYFPSGNRVEKSAAGAPGHIVAASQLRHYKGMDVLLEALSRIADHDWRLTVAGDGPDRAALQEQARLSGIDQRIDWRGWVPAHTIPALLASADLAVLPSRYEGWGAVANEALAQGTPLVISRAAGSSCLVSSEERGNVVPPEDPEALAGAMVRELDRGNSDARRDAIAGWAAAHIAPETAARFFAEALRNPQAAAIPPWLSASPRKAT